MISEDQLDRVMKEFIARIANHAAEGDESLATVIASHLEQPVSDVVRQTFYSMGFIGISNPKLLSCDMPHNPHSYRQSRASKHCAQCGADYCDRHPLTNCVKCGNQL
ncbi:MAG TPA: hypothetical protein VEI03_18205 [Stellaceae bacterium]|nr:hypothetical protein [Stellaceae bacterium]